MKSGIHVDLRVVRDEEFPAALHYFTGSKEHNIELPVASLDVTPSNELALRQALPGYRLSIERSGGIEWLAFRPCTDNAGSTDLSTASVEEPVDVMGTGSVDHRRGTRWITGANIGGSPAPISPQAAPSNGWGPP